MILTVTINPALDKSTTVAKMMPEKKLRCAAPVIEAGGGGINVSRAICELKGETVAIFPSGGTTGEQLRYLLEDGGVRYRTVPVETATRENLTVTDGTTDAQYRFIMPGGALSAMEVEKCLQEAAGLSSAAQVIVASGSLAPGVPDDFFARLARMSRKSGAKLIVDTSGIPLQQAAKEGVYLLKPNLSELCTLAGREYLQLDEVADAAREVINNGYCKVLVVSMGPAGALLITATQTARVTAPVVKRVSTVGAGDSMVAGIAYMLERQQPLEEALRFGVACGTAATMNPGTRLFMKADALRLYEWLKKI